MSVQNVQPVAEGVKELWFEGDDDQPIDWSCPKHPQDASARERANKIFGDFLRDLVSSYSFQQFVTEQYGPVDFSREIAWTPIKLDNDDIAIQGQIEGEDHPFILDLPKNTRLARKCLRVIQALEFVEKYGCAQCEAEQHCMPLPQHLARDLLPQQDRGLFGQGPGAQPFPPGIDFTTSRRQARNWNPLAHNPVKIRSNYYVSVGNETLRYVAQQSYKYNRKVIPIQQPGPQVRCQPSDVRMKTVKTGQYQTEFCLRNDDAIYVATALKERFENTAFVNLANEFTRGGGFLHGAAAFEEECCKRSNLYQHLSLHQYPLRNADDPMHTDIVYSPNVVVFRHGRDARYELMQEPVELGVITGAAVDVKHDANWELDPITGTQRLKCLNSLRSETYLRLRAVLYVAQAQGVKALVILPWGAGAFQNPPEMVVQILRHLLLGEFQGVFQNVTFAVIDDHNTGHRHNPRGNFMPFAEGLQDLVGPPPY